MLRRFEGLKGELSIVGNGGEKGSDDGRLWAIGMGEFYCLGARWRVEREVRPGRLGCAGFSSVDMIYRISKFETHMTDTHAR